VLEEAGLRRPGEALIVDLEAGDGRRRWALAEQRADGLALVKAERGQAAPTTFGASDPRAVTTCPP
jgi:hypothetical protein